MTFQSNQSGFNNGVQPEFELAVGSAGRATEHKSLASLRKRIFDFTLAGLTLIFTMPILLVIAVLIKLQDGGQVLFAQERVGVNGKMFKCYKFRSMVANAQERLDHLLATDPEARAEWEQTQKLRRDPRITRLGAFLRKSSLDELPQLWNIVRGDMSIVGPRPQPVNLNEQYRNKISYFMKRHNVKPGITGLAQISGARGETATIDDMSTRINFDLEYIKKWSLFLDIKIIYKTIFAVINGTGS